MHYFLNRDWLQLGVGGIVLFIITDVVLRYTLNPNYVPIFLILGAFIVPVAFAAYFYHQEHLLDQNLHGGIPLGQTAIMFFIGGIIGVTIAVVLENPLNFASDLANFLSISAIEEAAKLVFPLVVFFIGRYRSEADGLVFGIATGLGFAALETMGYSLTILISPGTGISDLEQVLVTRGFFGPLSHAAWTGLICGALWHYRGQGRKLVFMAIAYFLLAVAMHTLWNVAINTDNNLIMYPGIVAIGAIGLFLVFRHLHHARLKAASALGGPPGTAAQL